MTPNDRLRIGIDFDGTLADSIGAAARFLEEVEGITLEPHERRWPPGLERIGGQRFAAMIADDRFFERLEFVDGAEEVTRSLLAHADVFLVTARNDAQVKPVRHWLKSHNLHFGKIVATSYQSKVAACRDLQLDLHFDDMLAHTADVMRETNTALALLAAPWNDLAPSDAEVLAGEHRIHADWRAFHGWAQGTFEGRLGPAASPR